MIVMASIYEVAGIIHSIVSGFEEECVKCLEANGEDIVGSIQEQLYSGLDGNEDSLRPGYSDDPYFQQTKGRWRNDPDGYIRWKEEKTPPAVSPKLNLSARPVDVPNLIITGAFHESIFTERKGDGIHIGTKGFDDGPLIVKKYGEQILSPGNTAKEYFNMEFLIPWLKRFFRDCGYK